MFPYVPWLPPHVLLRSPSSGSHPFPTQPPRRACRKSASTVQVEPACLEDLFSALSFEQREALTKDPPASRRRGRQARGAVGRRPLRPFVLQGEGIVGREDRCFLSAKIRSSCSCGCTRALALHRLCGFLSTHPVQTMLITHSHLPHRRSAPTQISTLCRTCRRSAYPADSRLAGHWFQLWVWYPPSEQQERKTTWCERVKVNCCPGLRSMLIFAGSNE